MDPPRVYPPAVSSPGPKSTPWLTPTRRTSLRRRLLAWYREERRALPWRESRDPYRIWISEVMLQQTRVETVLAYWPRFVERFPDFQALAAASEEEVLALWSGLGYYSRARGLWRAAQDIVRRGGEFPRRREEALALPGVGPYTAGAVLSIAHGLPEALVDGNVARVFSRLFEIEDELGSGAHEKAVWGLARELVPLEGAGDWNQALMELGATVCKTPAPSCTVCPLARSCAARRAGREALLPRPKPRPETLDVQLCIHLCEKAGRVLLEERPAAGRMAGMWQFPTNELSASGLFPAEVAAPLVPGEPLGELRHSITRHRIRAEVRRARLGGRRASNWRWFRPAELEDLPLTGMAKKVLRLGCGVFASSSLDFPQDA